jgi:hypothetical protein
VKSKTDRTVIRKIYRRIRKDLVENRNFELRRRKEMTGKHSAGAYFSNSLIEA